MNRILNTEFASEYQEICATSELLHTDESRDERVPFEWQGSTVFRAAHFVAAALVLAFLAIGVGVYSFAARDDRAPVAVSSNSPS